MSQASHGWLESATMDVLRARLIKRLSDTDRFGRFRVFCPVFHGKWKECLSVHSKLLIADDQFVRIGSANVSNRSLGFDTECDLAFQPNPDAARAIASLRNSLLAEHLGVAVEEFARVLAEKNSLIGAIDALRANGARTLEPLNSAVPEWLNQMIPESAVVDPESSIAPEKLIDEFVSSHERESSIGPLLRGALILIVMVGLAAAWRWTPLADLLDVQTVENWAASLEGTTGGPLWVIGAFLIGGIASFPVTILILATAYAFSPWRAVMISLLGSVVSAVFLYAIGRQLGRKNVARFAGKRLNRLNRTISRHGVLAVAAIRMIPVAPYSLVNLAAGAVRVPLRDFVFGTLLGMSPGVLGITFFESQLEETMRQPSVTTILVLAGTLILLFLGIFAIRRWFAGKRSPGRRKLSTLRDAVESR
jgi:phospholipase D1/2